MDEQEHWQDLVAHACRDGQPCGMSSMRRREIADLVLYFASDRADNITGSDFVIDGELVKIL